MSEYLSAEHLGRCLSGGLVQKKTLHPAWRVVNKDQEIVVASRTSREGSQHFLWPTGLLWFNFDRFDSTGHSFSHPDSFWASMTVFAIS